MNRKKFFAMFATGFIGMSFIRTNPFKYLLGNNKGNKIKVKLNPDAVRREKSGKKNG